MATNRERRAAERDDADADADTDADTDKDKDSNGDEGGKQASKLQENGETTGYWENTGMDVPNYGPDCSDTSINGLEKRRMERHAESEKSSNAIAAGEAEELLRFIERAKTRGFNPWEFVKERRAIFARYNRRLKELCAIDFDDMLQLFLELLQNHPQVMRKFGEQYEYILIDEHQDTNTVQQSGKDTSPYTKEQQEKMVALVKENRERKKREKQAKLKAIADEQAAKMKELEEEMEKRKKAAEEEAAAEEEKERMRIESGEGSSGGTMKRDIDAEMEKKINDLDGGASGKLEPRRCLSALRSGFRDFAREIVTHIGSEVGQLRDNVGKFCEGAIEGAKAIAVVEGEGRPRKEPVKLKFPDAYGGKKEENFDNWEASVNSYIYLQHILPEERVLVAFQALKDEATSFARSLARAVGCENNLVAYSKVIPLSQFLKLLKERFADPTRGVRASDKLQTIHSRQWKSARALKGTMDDLVAVPDHGFTETQLVQLFYRAMPEALRGHFFDKSQQVGIMYDALSREVVLYESKPMPVTTFWHKDLDKGKTWKGRTISGQVRAKDHMILTLEEGGTDEVPYSQIEWGLEEEDNSVGQGRSYAAVAVGGRPQGRGGGQGLRGQAMGGRGPGARAKGARPWEVEDRAHRGLAAKEAAKREVGVKVPHQIARVIGPRNDEVEGHLKEVGTQACHRADPGKTWAWTNVYDRNAWTREHQGHMRQVLEKLREANFEINAKKCEWANTQVLYLGHVLDGDGIKPEDSKIATIRDWPTPRTLTELRSFLGLANYYRKFVRNFSTIAAPLRKLLKKEAIWQWDKDCTSALKRLKRALIEYPVLKVADPSLPFVVTMDASQYGIGAVLQHDDGNGYRPVEFMSARMPSDKVATLTYERELYALRQALEHWKHYLLGRHFKVYSDHETLRWLKTQAKMTPKLTRWAGPICYDPGHFPSANSQ
ncbi:hypothetical protein CBR_g26525 [Chara braunii]|uniref:Reverse transcriptase/retrotransposon-derived protein RNase H-like domain-containing protein n=1 Tax=Chara braunii TaxID=69332 RepID=A0A388L870_CHABU|nr:hypothetical protein CBR_g26525 [Chara braunii]|eukprot:GBG78496.1 hypothetical protein CBR_g26525 [Chara braunii]